MLCRVIIMKKKKLVLIIISVGIAFWGGFIWGKNSSKIIFSEKNLFSKEEFLSSNKMELEENKTSYFSKNPSYELFYGEWEISEIVYVDPVPTRGTEYTEQELEDSKSYYYNNTEIRKIQFMPDTIVVNGSKNYDEIIYDYIVFPADIDYHIHFTMTSKDIGLTEDVSDYYLFIKAISGKSNIIITFFIKDPTTIIAYYGFYCVEYNKISDDGNASEISIIVGKKLNDEPAFRKAYTCFC